MAYENILEIKVNTNFVDSFREAYPSIKRYTRRKKSALKQERLDYFLISENLPSSVNSTSVQRSYRSDNFMMTLDI